MVLSNSTNARTPDEPQTLDLMANSTVELLYHGDFAGDTDEFWYTGAELPYKYKSTSHVGDVAEE